MARAPVVAVFNDSPDSAELLIATFRLMGFAAEGGALSDDGLELPAFLQRLQPDVVVFDVPPPFEALVERFRALRAAHFPHLPVLLTTTDGRRLEQWLKKEEVNGVFVKPYDLDAIAGALAALR